MRPSLLPLPSTWSDCRLFDKGGDNGGDEDWELELFGRAVKFAREPHRAALSMDVGSEVRA
jgi:hypothetical protein